MPQLLRVLTLPLIALLVIIGTACDRQTTRLATNATAPAVRPPRTPAPAPAPKTTPRDLDATQLSDRPDQQLQEALEGPEERKYNRIPVEAPPESGNAWNPANAPMVAPATGPPETVKRAQAAAKRGAQTRRTTTATAPAAATADLRRPPPTPASQRPVSPTRQPTAFQRETAAAPVLFTVKQVGGNNPHHLQETFLLHTNQAAELQTTDAAAPRYTKLSPFDHQDLTDLFTEVLALAPDSIYYDADTPADIPGTQLRWTDVEGRSHTTTVYGGNVPEPLTNLLHEVHQLRSDSYRWN